MAILNLKQFIFECIDQDRAVKNKVDINQQIYENFTPRELESMSMSNQSGKLYVLDNGKSLVFNKPSGESIKFTLEHSLDELLVHDTITCNMSEINEVNLATSDILTSYTGGGALTLHTGVEFQFSTPIYEGKYLLEERTGFNYRVILTRVE